ncbi:MAG: response regulator [Bacteroidota bacterium]
MDASRQTHVLDSILRHAPLLVFGFDADARITFRRGHALLAADSTEADHIGERITERFADIPDLVAGVEKVLQGETAQWSSEVNGRHYQTTCEPLRDADGHVTGGIGVAMDATEQTQKQTRSDALYEAARHADATLWAFDADRRMTLHIGAPLETLGVGQGWNVGEDMAEVYADLPVVVDAVESVLQGEETSWNVTLDGRTFKSVVSPMRGDRGAVVGGVGLSIDITDQVHAEREAALQAERLRALTVVFGERGLSMDEHLHQALRASLDTLGLDLAMVSQIEGETYTVRACVAPKGVALAIGDTFPLSEIPCSLTLARGDVFAVHHVSDSEYRRHPFFTAFGLESYLGAPIVVDGRVVGTINFSAQAPREAPFTESDYDLVRLVANWAGALIEREGHRRQLIASEQRFQGIFHSQYQFQGLLSPDGTLLEVNDSATAFAGVPREELVGKKFWDCHWWQIDEATQEQLRAAIEKAASGEFVRYTVEVQGGDTVIPIDFSLKPLRDANTGEVVLLIPEGRDVSEMVQTEQTLHETVEALAEARDQADAANRAKSAFLAAMSHEIRTPMNAVIGFGDLLNTTPLSPQQQDYVRTIQNAGDRLLGLIDDILDFSKVEAGHLPIESEPLETEPLLVGALEEVATQAAKKGLELAYVIAEGVPGRVVGDRRRIRQILANLLSNAVKFTDSGSVELYARAEPDGFLAVSIQDTGIGITAERLPKVFDAFVQADGSTARRFGGTGLGLAISRKLATAMGGTLTASSRLGEGSTFTLRLPLAAAPEAGRVVLRTATTALGGVSVLLVDDDPVGRAAIVERLTRWGMTVMDTPDPSEALRWLDEGYPFDLGVLDMVMPGTDGLEVAAAIRKRRDPTALPLVLLSSEPEARHAPDLVLATVCKPVAPSALHDLLARALATREALPSTLQHPDTLPTSSPLEAHSLRILLAEDEPDNQLLAVRMLGEMGFGVEVAATGAEALERLHQHPYDVVLMDVMMPKMDGLEATRRLRAELPPERQPRVIALTARAMASDREACFAAGMDDFLPKPFRMAALQEILSQDMTAEA